MSKGYCRSHHVVLPLLLLHHRDLTNRGHAHHHRLDTGQIREKEEWGEWCGEKKWQWRKGLPIRHAEISGHRAIKGVNNRQCERGTGVETQARHASTEWVRLPAAGRCRGRQEWGRGPCWGSSGWGRPGQAASDPLHRPAAAQKQIESLTAESIFFQQYHTEQQSVLSPLFMHSASTLQHCSPSPLYSLTP